MQPGKGPAKPAAPAPAGAGTPLGGGTSPYQQMHDQMSSMPPPDPTTFLKLIWGILNPHQRDLVTAMMKDPAAGQPLGPAAPAQAGPPAPPAQ